jgi:anhydro-N-acetylmuramic acid kinase
MAMVKAIGLMSGTSLDGVDVALIETDGEAVGPLGPVGYRPYEQAEQALLRRALADVVGLSDRTQRPSALAEAEDMITRAHAEAVEDFLIAKSVNRDEVAIVGFHGQTVLHKPEARLTIQIGDGAALAGLINLPVAYDFRAADVAAGGEGAPLTPVFHRALALKLGLSGPLAVLNIGGVANVTYLDGNTDPIAFDTGPGNAPIDELVRERTGEAYDRDGKLAALGKVHEEIIVTVLADSYFSEPPPKSLDRATFAQLPLEGLSDADAAATATALVAASVARAADYLPKPPSTWIVAGGGARNPVLVSLLRSFLVAPITLADELGWSADALEAQAFAYLAVRSLKKFPITFPTTTGVDKPMTGGVLAEP